MKKMRSLAAGANNLVHPRRVLSRPIHLQIEVTTYCNLDCVMCPRSSVVSEPRHMSLDQFKYVFDTLEPLKISLSGQGEPFLNPAMTDIIRYATDRGAETITTSNLTIISEEMAAAIVESGLGLLKGSIDSVDPKTYAAIRRRDLHGQVIQGLRNLRDAKRRSGGKTPLLRLQYVMQKANFREIPQVLEVAEELEVDAIYFQPIDLAVDEFYDSGLIESLVGGMDREEFRGVLGAAAERAARSRVATNLPALFKDFAAVWEKYELVADPNVESAVCLMPWTSIYLTVGGDVRPCCSFGVTESMTMGNIFEEDFMEIWNNERYRNLRTRMRSGERPHKICKNCIAPTLWRILKSSHFGKFMLFR